MIPYFEKSPMQRSTGNKRQCNDLQRKRTTFWNGKLKVCYFWKYCYSAKAN